MISVEEDGLILGYILFLGHTQLKKSMFTLESTWKNYKLKTSHGDNNTKQ